MAGGNWDYSLNEINYDIVKSFYIKYKNKIYFSITYGPRRKKRDVIMLAPSVYLKIGKLVEQLPRLSKIISCDNFHEVGKYLKQLE